MSNTILEPTDGCRVDPLTRHIAFGARRARRLLQTAEVSTAGRAHAIRLVHEVVAADGLAVASEAALRLIQQGALDTRADARNLIFLRAGRLADKTAGEETGRGNAMCRTSTEGQEGMTAFLDKRSPAWLPGTRASSCSARS